MKKPILIGKYGETEIRRAIKNGELDANTDITSWCRKTGRTGDEKNVREALYYILRTEHGCNWL